MPSSSSSTPRKWKPRPDAGAAHGKPQFLPVAGLHEHARRVGQHVTQREGAAVPERLGWDEAHGGRRLLQGAALLLKTRCVSEPARCPITSTGGRGGAGIGALAASGDWARASGASSSADSARAAPGAAQDRRMGRVSLTSAAADLTEAARHGRTPRGSPRRGLAGRPVSGGGWGSRLLGRGARGRDGQPLAGGDRRPARPGNRPRRRRGRWRPGGDGAAAAGADGVAGLGLLDRAALVVQQRCGQPVRPADLDAASRLKWQRAAAGGVGTPSPTAAGAAGRAGARTGAAGGSSCHPPI